MKPILFKGQGTGGTVDLAGGSCGPAVAFYAQFRVAEDCVGTGDEMKESFRSSEYSTHKFKGPP